MVFAVKAAKMAVSSRKIELEGAVALCINAQCNSPFFVSNHSPLYSAMTFAVMFAGTTS